jgi:hypothetical protein
MMWCDINNKRNFQNHGKNMKEIKILQPTELLVYSEEILCRKDLRLKS